MTDAERGTARASALSRLWPPGAERVLPVLMQVLGSSWVLGAVLTLLSWQPLALGPGVGFDPSWWIALHMATVERLNWGTDLVFHYGPLGFLRYPIAAYDAPAILGTVYLTLLRYGLCVSLIWAARRNFHLAIAFAIALVAASLNGLDSIVPLAFIWCAVAVGDDRPAFAQPLLVFGGAIVSATELLVKLNTGSLVLGMCVIAVLAAEGRRLTNVLRFAATFAATFSALWFATGQGVGNFDDWVAGSQEIVSGYSAAMTATNAGTWTIYVALGIVAATLAAAYYAARRLPPVRRVALLALVALLGFIAFKQGFVRHSPGHMSSFFAWMLAPWIALRWTGAARSLSFAALAATAALYFGATGFSPPQIIDPADAPASAVREVRAALDPDTREGIREAARTTMRADYGLDPASLELLRGHRVHVHPWETSLVWAYGLEWEPVPMFQTATAYTPDLDRQNAEALASPEGPERILRHGVGLLINDASSLYRASRLSIDLRYGPYDSPAQTLAMLCHFKALRSTQRYEVLGRTSDRCGPPRPLGSIETAYDEPVRVPRASPGRHDVVFARVHGLAPSGIEWLRTALFRAPRRRIVFDGERGFHLVPRVAEDGLILTAPRRVDFPWRWSLAPNARTIEFRKDPGIASPEGDLSIDFFAMRVRPEGKHKLVD